VYNGDKLTHFTVSKLATKISVLGYGDMGTSSPHNFSTLSPMELAIWCVSLRRCTVWLLASERPVSKSQTMPSVAELAVEAVYFHNDSIRVVSMIMTTPCQFEGSQVKATMNGINVLRAPHFFLFFRTGPGLD